LTKKNKLVFFRHAEIFQKFPISQRNGSSFGRFGNIFFGKIKSSKLNNYLPDTPQTCY
jgi:hypothetical protein